MRTPHHLGDPVGMGFARLMSTGFTVLLALFIASNAKLLASAGILLMAYLNQ